MAHPGGRPTKYKKKYNKMMIEFFNRKPVEIKEIKDKNNKVIGTIETVNDLPTIEGFAVLIGVDDSTLLNWTTRFPEFFATYKICKSYQKNILVQNGLKGNYNSCFAKFVAINATDMKEKVEYIGKTVNTNIDYTALSEDEAKELYKKKQEELKNE